MTMMNYYLLNHYETKTEIKQNQTFIRQDFSHYIKLIQFLVSLFHYYAKHMNVELWK